jgi:argininosuccinate lyase
MAFDGRIARHVIRTNMAHMISLLEGGEVSKGVCAACLTFLSRASATPAQVEEAEDFHQLLEQEAVDALGVEVAGYLNLGKSRNDQVATAIRMELREQILNLQRAIGDLQLSVLNVAGRHGNTVIPGYTHLQHAQPVTLAHHLFAYSDCLQRDVERLFELYGRVNLSPMGSAALAGTTIHLDRRRVASLLGFEGPVANAMDAVSSRDFAVEAVSCAALVMLDLSRISEELILWSSREFAFIELSDEFAASSSIMPQKKNPVAAEIIRAKCGSTLGNLMAISAIMKALPYSYNLDLQETTLHLWRAMDDAVNSVRILGGMIATVKFRIERLEKSTAADYSTATALANYMVEKEGISFRQAHAIVGELVRVSVEGQLPFEDVVVKLLPKVSSQTAKRIRIGKAKLSRVLDPAGSLASIVTDGGSNPASIPAELEKRLTRLTLDRGRVSKLVSSLISSEAMLREALRSETREVRN